MVFLAALWIRSTALDPSSHRVSDKRNVKRSWDCRLKKTSRITQTRADYARLAATRSTPSRARPPETSPRIRKFWPQPQDSQRAQSEAHAHQLPPRRQSICVGLAQQSHNRPIAQAVSVRRNNQESTGRIVRVLSCPWFNHFFKTSTFASMATRRRRKSIVGKAPSRCCYPLTCDVDKEMDAEI